MADNSVSEAPENNPLFDFEKRHLSESNNHRFMRLEDWVTRKTTDDDGDLMLQMDIEGGEYTILLDTPRNILKRFRIIVIEFHSLDLLLANSTFNFMYQCFKKLLENFCVVHLHPNNCMPATTYNGFEIPPVMEMTFYRKDRVVVDSTPLRYPHLLDSKNVFDNADLVLPECWRKNLNHIDDFLRVISGVIHVGANIGQERLAYDQLGLSVIWIEPIEAIFSKLAANIAQLPNQVALNYLITDKDNGDYPFYLSNNEGASSSIFKPTGHLDLWPEVAFPDETQMTSTTLATVIDREQIDLSGYQALVIDTQGSELLVLKGLGDGITAFRYIKTEAADFDAYEGCCRLQELSDYLAKFGFTERNRANLTTRTSGGNYYEVLFVRQ